MVLYNRRWLCGSYFLLLHSNNCYAKESESVTGIDATFILAQAALESGWGERAVGNMFFGVKATKDTPANKKQLLRTREVLNHDKGVFPEIISITKRKDGK